MAKWGGCDVGDEIERYEFRVDRLPVRAQNAFARAGVSWRDAVEDAIRGGVSEPSALADLMFFLQHRERMTGVVGRAIDRKEEGFFHLRAEWNLYRAIASRRLRPEAECSVFLPAHRSESYEDRVAAQTTGLVTLFVHGRSAGPEGPSDRTDGFDSMQAAVESLGAGDSIYLATWQCNPSRLPLTVSRPGIASWGELLGQKAEAGVAIRLVISDMPPDAAAFRSSLDDCARIVESLPIEARDRFKYILSMHPARVFDPRKLLHAGTRSSPFTEVGMHHQTFMVLKTAGATIAYCGGLDLSPPRTPPAWQAGSPIWHDVHARLEGLVALDLEREFVERWNREKDRSTAPMLPGWQPPETLDASAPERSGPEAGPLGSMTRGRGDRTLARNTHKVQLVRTVALGIESADVRRDDIWQAYFQLIGSATQFLLLESPCFHEPRLADAIVKQAEAQPGLVVVLVVSSDADDPTTKLTQHGPALQSEFLARFTAGIPAARRGIYTMSSRLVHAKLVLVDDRALTMGSATACPRGFFLDTELNVVVDAPPAVAEFRHRLWAHELGVSEAEVASWPASDFVARWDAIARRNEALADGERGGASVVPYDPVASRTKRSAVAEAVPASCAASGAAARIK
ncbi:MAG TPA: phospholipase D-like domain-containing protein [Kofleriaceae bacterium]|nr:phospholipase D-like domain-containing protein [Kofleriaceae bacterium]